MKIDEYKELCEDIEVSEKFYEGYEKALRQIKEENASNNNEKVKHIRPRGYQTLTKVAAAVAVILLLGGGTAVSVNAYISHLNRLKNMEDTEIIEIYENVVQYDSGYMSRPLSDWEGEKWTELYEAYCKDQAEPTGEVSVIQTANEYTGRGLAFAKEDGILYLPEEELTEEEILQMVEFGLIQQYADYEAYLKATNPDYYMNALEEMTSAEVDEIYKTYYCANTETGFFSRELSVEEMGRRKTLKELYKNGIMTPEKTIAIAEKKADIPEDSLAFCSNNCTFYLPERALNDEEILEMLDFQIKVTYSENRIAEEIESGARTDWPEIEYVVRDRIITLDHSVAVDEEILNAPWLAAYEEVLNQFFERNENFYEDPERYYANVRFIYFNDDDTPEMVFEGGYTDMDYDDRCNIRNLLYTYKDGEAVLLSPDENVGERYYNESEKFSYVEKKGMVLLDYYYSIGYLNYVGKLSDEDQIFSVLTKIDTWDLDTMTRTSTPANMEMEHAEYDYETEEYADATFTYEYFINITDIIEDENGTDIIGEKVDKETFERAEEDLWNGEERITLEVSDFDKIYCDDNVLESLARSYQKVKEN